MTRNVIHRTVRMALATTVVFLAAAAASGAVIFQDDFAGAGSAGNWEKYASAPDATAGGGTFAVNNTTGGFYASYTRVFDTKPSTFTLSFVLKSSTPQGGGGIMFCKQGGQNFNGYFLNIVRDAGNTVDMVAVWKSVQTISGSITNVDMTENVFAGTSLFLNPDNNKLTVSKNGSTFHLFVNDEFLAEFTDATYASGDIALVAGKGVTASFGAVHMTNEFTAGGLRTTFRDEFNGSELQRYWDIRKYGEAPSASVTVGGGVLTAATAANTTVMGFVDIGLSTLSDFEVSVDVRHISGSATHNDLYGIVLAGAPASGAIPTVHFGITGDQYYFVGSGSLSGTKNTVINGAVKHEADILTVRKRAGAATYEFLVNNEIVSSSVPVASFPITAVCITVDPRAGAMTVSFDNFYAGPIDGNASISIGRSPHQQQTVRRGSVVRNENPVFYDLRGRRRYAVSPAANGKLPRRAAGVYVNENGRSVAVRKNSR